MKQVFIFFSLLILLGGIVFFFTLEFKEQEEVATVSTELGTTEVGSMNTDKTDLNSSQNKKASRDVEEEETKGPEVEKALDSEVKDIEDDKRANSEFELDPQYYPSVGGYLKVDGDDIQALEIFFRETESFIISLGFKKVTNSIFQVENSFWNLHRNSDGKSYNVRVGSGPLSGNIVTFTAKREQGDVESTDDEQVQAQTDSGESKDPIDSDDQTQYGYESPSDDQDDQSTSEDNNEVIEDSTFE